MFYLLTYLLSSLFLILLVLSCTQELASITLDVVVDAYDP